jgi:hypothetical protein
MKRMRVWHVCLVAAVTAVCAASLLGGCGNDSKILEIKASSSVDNAAHAATINTSEEIVGNALMWVVLTYPDGHSQLVMSAHISGGGGGGGAAPPPRPPPAHSIPTRCTWHPPVLMTFRHSRPARWWNQTLGRPGASPFSDRSQQAV